MADDPLIEKVPEPARDNAAYERRKARQQQHQAEEAARDSPRDSSDRLENDADGDLDLDQAYDDPHRMTPTMRLLYFFLLMVIAGMVGYLILIVLYSEQFAARDWIDATATKERPPQGR